VIKLLLDENFNNNMLRGVLRRLPELDYVRAQDELEIAGMDDPTVLAWAAEHNRILLTHDVQTMTRYAYERVEASLTIPRVFEVSQTAPLGMVIKDILILVECSLEGEWDGQVRYIPFQ
jgi:hypothetical protein